MTTDANFVVLSIVPPAAEIVKGVVTRLRRNARRQDRGGTPPGALSKKGRRTKVRRKTEDKMKKDKKKTTDFIIHGDCYAIYK